MPIQRKITQLNLEQQRRNNALNRIFTYRLTLALAIFAVLATLSIGVRNSWLLFALLALAAGFAWLVRISREIRKHLARVDALQDFYERQMRRVQGQPPTTPQPQLEKVALAMDLDFFGEHSLLSQIDETLTESGRQRLAQHMLSPVLDQAAILNRQAQVRRLSTRAGFLRKLVVIGHADVGARPGLFDAEMLTVPFVDGGFNRRHLISWVLFAALVGAVTVASFVETAIPVGGIWFIYFAYSMFAISKSGEVFTRIQTLGLHVERLAPIYRHLERLPRGERREFLPNLDRNPISPFLARIDRLTSLLSVQTHPLVVVLVNGLIPWSLFFAWRAEALRQELERLWAPQTNELHEFETLASLALVYRYQTKTFPTFTSNMDLQLREIRHPLISTTKAVANTFSLPAGKRLVLITGSNMSGKSTFLRTVGINQTLALMGAPVFADSMVTRLARPLTCIRVSDSVRDGVSYFYAETLRLKAILDQAGPNTIYLIDEMFRGTNNRERLAGSQAVAAALVATKSLGFITTHDLELTHLEERQPEVGNYHFADDLDASGLRFSYRIHDGPCPTTNALKIMKSLGLPVPSSQ